jgi:hypothetical protein
MFIYEYKKKRISSDLFSERIVLDKSYMPEDQVIIYYPRKMLDISNMSVACMFKNYEYIKFFRDNFLNELKNSISAIFGNDERIIETVKPKKIILYNNSMINFISSGASNIVLSGISITSLITDENIDVQYGLSRIRPL